MIDTTTLAAGAVAGFEDATIPLLGGVRQYARRLAGNGADADDLTQTTYLNALRGWHTFQPGSDARRWLLRICRNAYFTSGRRRRWVVYAEDEELESLLASTEAIRGSEALEALEQRDLGQAIDAEIAALSEAYREVVLMIDVEGYQYDEVAADLGIPIGTVRSRLYRGRRLLQRGLISRAEDAGLIGGRR